MPQLVEYNAPEGLGLRPSEVGIEATAAAARRVNAAYNEAAGVTMAAGHMRGSAIAAAGDAAVNYLDHQQISQGSAAFAGLTAKATADWNNRNKVSDPNNQSIGQDWLQNVLEPQLQAFKGGFITEKGQDWAEANVEKLRNHFTTKVTADMSRKAGEAVSSNHAQALNSWSVAVNGDPSLLDEALGLTDRHTKDLVNTSGVEDKPSAITQLTQKNKEILVNSAAEGYIQQHGEMPPWINDPKYSGYIKLPELRKLQRDELAYRKLQQSEDNAARRDYDYKQKQDFHSKAMDLGQLTVPMDNETTPQLPTDYMARVRELYKHPGADRGTLEDLEKRGNAIISGLDKKPPSAGVSHATTMDFLSRMQLPDDDPRKITNGTQIDEAYSSTPEHPNGLLTTGDRNFLQKELLDRTTERGKALAKDREDFFKRFANTIDPGLSLGMHTALGQQQMYLATTDAKQKEAALKAKGEDPRSLYDPGSPNYLGKDISKYSRSLKEANDYDAALRKGQPPPAPTPQAPTPAVPPGTGIRSMNDLPVDVPTPGPDGNTYVRKIVDGVSKLFQVKAGTPPKPAVPMSR
jgi:hypothetical protein